VPRIHLTASQWIEQHRRGTAAMVDGRRHVVARDTAAADPAFVEVDVDEPDVRCAIVDGRLEAEDLARLLNGYLVHPKLNQLPH
jgi:hypothetical protein